MSKLSDTNNSNAVVLFGNPGTGKTSELAQLANAGCTLHILDIEGGSSVLNIAVNEEAKERVNVYRIWDDSQNAAGIKIVSRIFDGRKPVTFCKEHSLVGCPTCSKLPNAADEFETVDVSQFGEKDILCVDSITQLINSACVHSAGARQVLQTRKLEWDNWSDLGQLMDFIFTKAQAAKFKTVFITHEMMIENAAKEAMIMPIYGTANYSRNCSRFFGSVIRCYVKNGTHRKQSLAGDNGRVVVKNRANLDINKCKNGLYDIMFPSKELLEQAQQEFKDAIAKPFAEGDKKGKAAGNSGLLSKLGK